jgi:uncharacterized membrane protein YjjB (DUF3815 family)
MIEQLITSFIATAGFGLLFNVQKEIVLRCGLSGMLGWIFYFNLVEMGVDSVAASGTASILIGVIGQLFARRYKTPIIIFNVTGIIPLVPGGLAYDAMRHFVVNDYSIALPLAAKAFLISGAIAVGLVLSEMINQIIARIRPAK